MKEYSDPVYLDSEVYLDIVRQITLDWIKSTRADAFPKIHVEDVQAQQVLIAESVAATLSKLRQQGYRLVK